MAADTDCVSSSRLMRPSLGVGNSPLPSLMLSRSPLQSTDCLLGKSMNNRRDVAAFSRRGSVSDVVVVWGECL